EAADVVVVVELKDVVEQEVRVLNRRFVAGHGFLVSPLRSISSRKSGFRIDRDYSLSCPAIARHLTWMVTAPPIKVTGKARLRQSTMRSLNLIRALHI